MEEHGSQPHVLLLTGAVLSGQQHSSLSGSKTTHPPPYSEPVRPERADARLRVKPNPPKPQKQTNNDRSRACSSRTRPQPSLIPPQSFSGHSGHSGHSGLLAPRLVGGTDQGPVLPVVEGTVRLAGVVEERRDRPAQSQHSHSTVTAQSQHVSLLGGLSTTVSSS